MTRNNRDSNARIYDSVVVIANTTGASSTTGGLVIEGGLSTRDTYIRGFTAINDVNITPNPGDKVRELYFTDLSTTESFTDIKQGDDNSTRIVFKNAQTSAFRAQISVECNSKYALFDLHGINNGGEWFLNSSFTGAITGVSFNIDNNSITEGEDQVSVGILQYKNTSEESASIRVRATTNSPSSQNPETDGIIKNAGSFTSERLIFASATDTLSSSSIKYENDTNSMTLGNLHLSGSYIKLPQNMGRPNPGIEGQLVYNKQGTGSFLGYNGDGWVTLGGEITGIWTKDDNDSVFYTTGNVGIGNTAPQAKLDVSGDISAGSLRLSGDITAGGLNVETIIASGAIESQSLSSGSLELSGDITAGGLSVNSIIASGAIESQSLSSGSLELSGDITAGGLSVNSIIASGAIKSQLLSSGSIQLSGDITAGGLNVNSIIASGAIKSQSLSSGSIQLSGDITAGDITAGGLSVNSIIASEAIKSQSLSSGSIQLSGDITAGGLSVNSIIASGAIKSQSLSSGSIQLSGDITAVISPDNSRLPDESDWDSIAPLAIIEFTLNPPAVISPDNSRLPDESDWDSIAPLAIIVSTFNPPAVISPLNRRLPAEISPLTSNFACGAVFPIPTLPVV
jgi:hypothetical protein